MCVAWGAHERGRRTEISAGIPSTLGRVKEEWEGASQAGKSAKQRFVEVRHGDNLQVHRAIYMPTPMPYRLFVTLYAHYAIQKNARKNIVVLAAHLGEPMTREDYYDDIDRGHHYLSARLTAPTEVQESVTGDASR
jgi:hypothetical protein